MRQEKDWSQIYHLIERMERDLSQLKSALPPSARTNRKTISSRSMKHRSLYGIFPSSKVTVSDFRAARSSWKRKPDDL